MDQGPVVDFYLFSNILRWSNPFRLTVQYSLLWSQIHTLHAGLI